MSSAVRQTPLTETLSPDFRSAGVSFAAMVIRRFSPRCSIRVTRPTSSIMPVNMKASNVTKHHKPTTEAQRHREKPFLACFLHDFVTPWWHGWSLAVRVAQISFDGEVIFETMKTQAFYLQGLLALQAAGARGEWNRSCRHDLRGVIQKDFI